MAETFKKIDKKFILSSSNVNCYGFRLMTDGYQANKFLSNPIGYYMHNRDAGVLLRWDNVRIEGDHIVAEPVVNLSHPRGQQTVDEIEAGFLNAASMGMITPIEVSDDPALMLEGQILPTITKWYNKECSLVDVPGNADALAQLVDEEGNKINLSDLTNQKPQINNNMFEIKLPLSAELIKLLNLGDKPDAVSVTRSIKDLSESLVAKDGELTKLKEDLSASQQTLADLKKQVIEKEVNDLLATALSEKRITNETKAKLATTFAENPTGLKDLLATMTPIVSVTDQLAKTGQEDAKKIENLSWDELHKGNHLKDLKANNKTLYNQKFKEKFGKEPDA